MGKDCNHRRLFPWSFIIVLCILSSCDKDDGLSDTGEKFVPTDVIVKTKSYYTIDKVFDFINSFDHDVEYIYNYGGYVSSLPPDSLAYILNYLNAKSYTNDGENWFVTGYLDDQTQIIKINLRLFHIKNKAYQADWLGSMEILELTQETASKPGGNRIFFHVLVGEEKEWLEKFKEYDFVEWAELNYIDTIYPFY